MLRLTAHVELTEKVFKDQKRIITTYRDTKTVDQSYSIEKNQFLVDAIRKPILDQLTPQLTDAISDSRVFRLLFNAEDYWELLANASDEGANAAIFLVNTGEGVVSALIDNGKGFNDFFASNEERAAIRASSPTGFVEISQIAHTIESHKKEAEKKEGVKKMGGRAKETRRLSAFLGEGNYLIGNVDDLRASKIHQEMIGIGPLLDRLPKTGAVIILRSPHFSKEAYLSYLKTNPSITVGTLEGNYQLYIASKYPELFELGIDDGPQPTAAFDDKITAVNLFNLKLDAFSEEVTVDMYDVTEEDPSVMVERQQNLKLLKKRPAPILIDLPGPKPISSVATTTRRPPNTASTNSVSSTNTHSSFYKSSKFVRKDLITIDKVLSPSSLSPKTS